MRRQKLHPLPAKVHIGAAAYDVRFAPLIWDNPLIHGGWRCNRSAATGTITVRSDLTLEEQHEVLWHEIIEILAADAEIMTSDVQTSRITEEDIDQLAFSVLRVLKRNGSEPDVEWAKVFREAVANNGCKLTAADIRQIAAGVTNVLVRNNLHPLGPPAPSAPQVEGGRASADDRKT